MVASLQAAALPRSAGVYDRRKSVAKFVAFEDGCDPPPVKAIK
jgi:hypothetical protein